MQEAAAEAKVHSADASAITPLLSRLSICMHAGFLASERAREMLYGVGLEAAYGVDEEPVDGYESATLAGVMLDTTFIGMEVSKSFP